MNLYPNPDRKHKSNNINRPAAVCHAQTDTAAGLFNPYVTKIAILKMNTPSDKLPSDLPDKSVNIRCPRLGHQIEFSYCRSENSGLPCFKTLDCWHHYFDVHTYFKKKLTQEDFNTAFTKTSRPKIFSLLDLIEQAKKSQEPKD
ncbi:MAG: hypothetical protein ABIJ59_20080 [Pseudomonadota bacterium]